MMKLFFGAPVEADVETFGGGHVIAMVEQSLGFDPYRAWLGVRHVRRPLTAYQLLGLPSHEEDAATIRAAAGLKRVALESHREEATPEVWAQVSGELEEAIEVLLDPDKKVAYDAALQRKSAAPVRAFVAHGGLTERGHTASVNCDNCGSPNPATRKFCAHCGQNLWEPCFCCGTLSAAGERFCGACGANLTSAAREQIALFDKQLAQVPELCAEKRFDEALGLLTAVAKLEHPRLASHADRAKELIEQLGLERQRAVAAAEAALRTAQGHLAAGDYEEARRVLAAVPGPLRNKAIEALWAEVQERREELADLDRALQAAVAAKNHTGLFPKIERLLQMQPDHALARQLSQRLQGQICRVAKTKIDNHQYSPARALLEQVPGIVRGPDTAKLLKQATELAWLIWDLGTAPHVDQTLLAVAQRLRKLAPDDQRGDRLLGELRRRLQAGERSSRLTPLPWVAPPATFHLGFPVDWAVEFSQVAMAEQLDARLLKEHPGCFFVACGLALQGVGQGPVKVNLHPGDQGGILGKVAKIMRKRVSMSATAWGIDLSSSGMKAIRLAWDPIKQRPAITHCDFIEHRKLLSQAVNEEEEAALIKETLDSFTSRNDVKVDRIAVGLPGTYVLSRELTLPPMDAAKLASAVQYEARHRLPCRPEDLVWDHQLQSADKDADAQGNGQQTVALYAAVRVPLMRRLCRFEEAGLRVDIVQSDCLALHNVLAYERAEKSAQAAHPDAAQSVWAILDVGSEATDFVVSWSGGVWSRSFSIGGHSFTLALVQRLKHSFAEAGRVKHDPGLASSFSEFYEAIEPVFAELVREIQLSLDSFARAHPQRPIGRMLGVGGGLRLHGLLRYLRCGR